MRIAAYMVLTLGVLLYLGPFVIQLATSFKTEAAAAAAPLSLIPDPVDLSAWHTAFGGDPTLPVPLGRWFTNSFVVTISVTLGRLIFDSMAGTRWPGCASAAGRWSPAPCSWPRWRPSRWRWSS